MSVMPRPRVHDPERVLDAVESLAARSGPAAVTIRAVSQATGASNGAVYHGFGSRAGLLGSAWLRAGRRFLDMQQSLVDGAHDAVAAVVAAADTPLTFAEHHPESAALLLAIRREELLAHELPTDVAEPLRRLDGELVGLLIRLADRVWGRRDAAAVDTITTCVVDLPTAIMLQRNRLQNPAARAQLHAAVRAVLAVGPKKGTPHEADL